jgi:hypothetical protein
MAVIDRCWNILTRREEYEVAVVRNGLVESTVAVTANKARAEEEFDFLVARWA